MILTYQIQHLRHNVWQDDITVGCYACEFRNLLAHLFDRHRGGSHHFRVKRSDIESVEYHFNGVRLVARGAA